MLNAKDLEQQVRYTIQYFYFIVYLGWEFDYRF